MVDIDNGKLRTIKLGGRLGGLFGREHKFYVSDPAEALRALCSQIKGFEAYMRESQVSYAVFNGKRNLDPTTELHDPAGADVIKIVPIVQGSKKAGLIQTVIGVALIVISFIPGFQAAAPLGAQMVFAAGVSLTLGGVAQMLSPQPKLSVKEAPQNSPSATFNGPVNTTAQGQPVPIVYGRGIVGSAIISAGIYAEDTVQA